VGFDVDKNVQVSRWPPLHALSTLALEP
jgi:hypothetical protein